MSKLKVDQLEEVTGGANVTVSAGSDLIVDDNLYVVGDITGSGHISGSSTSTGSYGRVEATRLSGDGTDITGLSSFAGAAGTEALISGSSTSTGSFGRVEATNYNVGADTTLSRNAEGVLQVETPDLQWNGYPRTVKMTGKETIWIPANAMTPTVTAGCSELTAVETTPTAGYAYGSPDMYVLDFNDEDNEHAQFSVAFPKSWDLEDGSNDITYQIFWSGIALNDPNPPYPGAGLKVDWGVQACGVGHEDSIDMGADGFEMATIITAQGSGTAEDMLIANGGGIAIGPWNGVNAEDQLCYFRVLRDVDGKHGMGDDDMVGDARLHGIKLFFNTDKANDD